MQTLGKTVEILVSYKKTLANFIWRAKINVNLKPQRSHFR